MSETKDRAQELVKEYFPNLTAGDWIVSIVSAIRQRESELRKESEQREALVVEGYRLLEEKYWEMAVKDWVDEYLHGQVAAYAFVADGLKELRSSHPNHAAILAEIERKALLKAAKEELESVYHPRAYRIEDVEKRIEALQPKEEG